MARELTNHEEIIVEALVEKGKTAEEIKKIIGKAPRSKSVERFLEGKAPKTYDRKEVLLKLGKASLDGKDAGRLIDRAVLQLKKAGNETPSTTEVYNEAVRLIGPRERMPGRDKGVRMMTQEASEMGDEVREKRSRHTDSRSYKDSVYIPNPEV